MGKSEKVKAPEGKGKRGNVRKSNANGEGSLEKRAGGIYIARWMYNGKRYAKSTGERDFREAQKKLHEFTEPFRLGEARAVAEHFATKVEGRAAEIKDWEDKQPALSIADAFDEYCTCGLASDSGAETLSSYGSHFHNLQRWIEANRPSYKEMREITQADAREFAADLKTRAAAGTFNKHIVFFRCLWRVLADADDGKSEPPRNGQRPRAKLPCNPWEKIEKRANITHTRRELTTEELAKIIASLEGEMRLLFNVGIHTGLRLHDCALLDWGSIDLVRGFVRLIPHKTKRYSTPVHIPMFPALFNALNEIPQEKRNGYVMPKIAETYNRNTALLSRYIQRVFIACGIKTQTQAEGERAQVDVGFHSLRHTFISLALNAGIPIAIVQAIVGHSNPIMTQHYHHIDDKALKAAFAPLAASMDKETPALPAPAPTGNLEAFRAIVERMTPAEIETAIAELQVARNARALTQAPAAQIAQAPEPETIEPETI